LGAGTSGRDSTRPMLGKSGDRMKLRGKLPPPAGSPAQAGKYFFTCSLTDNAALADAVHAAYAQPALVPPSLWLEAIPPVKPKLTVVENSRSSLRLQWETADNPAWLWVLQFRTNQIWTTEILPAVRTNWSFAKPAPEWISISAV